MARYTFGCNAAEAIDSAADGSASASKFPGRYRALKTNAPVPTIPFRKPRRLTFSIWIMSSPELALTSTKLTQNPAASVLISYLHSSGLQVRKILSARPLANKQKHCPVRWALAYSSPAARRAPHNETRISPLAFPTARHGTWRGGLRALGAAADGLPHQRGRRVGTGRAEHGGRAGRIYRCGPHQILPGEFDQRAQLLQQGSASVSPELRAVSI